eukprot:Gb_19578 [translate_table: standard]
MDKEEAETMPPDCFEACSRQSQIKGGIGICVACRKNFGGISNVSWFINCSGYGKSCRLIRLASRKNNSSMIRGKEGSLALAETSLGVKEGAARAVLRDVWRHGHETVELRQDGKRVIFFCTLCSTRCYSDGALSDHLNGNLHARRYAAAKISILASPPWPFNDGVGFSFPSSKQEGIKTLPPPPSANNNNNNYEENHIDERECKENGYMKESQLSNPRAASYKVGMGPNLPLEWIGSGHISLRVLQSSIASPVVKAVWCCWLGENRGRGVENEGTETSLAEWEYAIVSFPYTDALGRGGNNGNSRPLRTSGSPMDIDRSSRGRKKKGRPPKVNSHPLFKAASGEPSNDITDSWQNADSQMGEKSVAASVELGMDLEGVGNIVIPNEVDGRLSLSKNLSNRALRRALRRQQVRALERLCFICHQQMLPGKDVAALLNRKSGLIACSSRNRRGAFHVFHTSCLIDWVLLCETKIWVSQLNGEKGLRKSRWSVLEQRNRICGGKQTSGSKGTSSNCGSVFCPECQGTGLKTRGGQLEVPRYKLAQVFDWILELIQSRKSWMDHPEQLEECATGLLFRPADTSQGNVLLLMLLHFYRAGGATISSRGYF